MTGTSGGHEYNEGEAGANTTYRESMLERFKMPTYAYFGSRGKSAAVAAAAAAGTSVEQPSARVQALRRLFDGALHTAGGGAGAHRLQRSFRFGHKVSELQRAAEHRLRAVAKKVIDDVLFNKERRVLFNRVARQEVERQAVIEVHNYYAKCKTGIGGEPVLPRRMEAAII